MTRGFTVIVIQSSFKPMYHVNFIKTRGQKCIDCVNFFHFMDEYYVKLNTFACMKIQITLGNT